MQRQSPWRAPKPPAKTSSIPGLVLQQHLTSGHFLHGTMQSSMLNFESHNEDRDFSSLIVHRFTPGAAPIPRVQATPVPVSSRTGLTTAPGPSKSELEAKRDLDFQAAQASRKEKQLAWAAFFEPQPICDHPVDWNAQVDCSNQYMRAKQAF